MSYMSKRPPNAPLPGTSPSWTFRRKLLSLTLLFSMGVIVVIIWQRWDDTRLAETVVISAFSLIGLVLSAYIGGAAWEDVKLRTAQRPDETSTPDVGP